MWYLADARKAHVTLCVDVDGDKSLLMVLMLLPSSDSVLLCGRFRTMLRKSPRSPRRLSPTLPGVSSFPPACPSRVLSPEDKVTASEPGVGSLEEGEVWGSYQGYRGVRERAGWTWWSGTEAATCVFVLLEVVRVTQKISGRGWTVGEGPGSQLGGCILGGGDTHRNVSILTSFA